MAEAVIKKLIPEHQNEAVIIPDSLEGVIEGANRHERYCRFMTGVLSKIWPADSNSGE